MANSKCPSKPAPGSEPAQGTCGSLTWFAFGTFEYLWCECTYLYVLGSNVLGSNPLGLNALGSNVLGSNVLGSNGLGSNGLGSNVFGSAPGSGPDREGRRGLRR